MHLNVISAKVGRVVGEIAKEREACRIEVCPPVVEVEYNGPRREDVFPALTAAFKLWHDSGSIIINLTSVAAIDALITQLGNAKEMAKAKIQEFEDRHAEFAKHG